MSAAIAAGQSSASATDVTTALRRRWPWLVGFTVLGAILGVLVRGAVPEATPLAVTAVEIQPTGIDLSSSSARREESLDAARAVVRAAGDDVLAAALAETGAPLTVVELREATTVSQQGDAPVIDVEVELDDADTAVALAAAIADAHLAREQAEATAARDARLDGLRAERDDALAEISALGTRIGTLEADAEAAETTPDRAQISALEGQRDAALRRVEELEAALVEVRAQNVDPGRVLQPAAIRDAGARLGELVAVPALAALGLLLGIVAALVADRRDPRVWTPEDVTAATGATAVVHVPRSDLQGEGMRTGGGHRRVRALVAPAQVRAGSVLVTGSSPEHGAGIAAGLAVAIAGSGRRTILVDASGADAFDLPGGDLHGWLAGRTGLDRAARSPEGVAALQVLTGVATDELAASATLVELLQSPQAIVVVHAPGGSESGDALSLAPVVDGAVVVAAARQDAAEVVARTYRWIARDAQGDPVVVLAG